MRKRKEDDNLCQKTGQCKSGGSLLTTWTHGNLLENICYHPLHCRIIHEAFQFLIRKKKRLTGRGAAENWGLTGGRSKVIGLLGTTDKRTQEERKDKR